MSINYDVPQPSNVEELAEFHVTCWRENYSGILPDHILDGLSVDEKAGMWRKIIADPRFFKLVVREGERLVGFIVCGPVRDGIGLGADGEVLALYLLKSVQGRGIGKELVARAAKFWIKCGGVGLVVLSFQANRGAAAYYEALGGVKNHSGKFELDGAVVSDHAHLFSDLYALAALGSHT